MPDLHARAGDQYRFRGHVAPQPGIRASVLDGGASDGVATLRLYDPIDSWGGEWGVSAKEFARSLDQLPNDTNEIRLHINSPGGEVYEGLAILNTLRQHKARVVAVVDGLAASAASFIAAGADEIVMAQNAQLMIHDAWGLCIGNAADMRELGARLDKISDNIAAIYAGKAGGSVQAWRTAMLAETWYSDTEAVAAGLADSVEEPAKVDADAKNAFDLSVFTYAGREKAPAPALPPTLNGLTLPQVGDRVVIDPQNRHEPTHDTGTIAEIGTTAYGVVMDDMPEMGVHRWYTGDEFTLTTTDPQEPASAPAPMAEPGQSAQADTPASDGVDRRARYQQRRHGRNAARAQRA